MFSFLLSPRIRTNYVITELQAFVATDKADRAQEEDEEDDENWSDLEVS
jgi:hypothetical protein